MFDPRAGTVAPSAFRTFPVDAAHAAAGEINARGNIAPPVPSQFMRSSPPRKLLSARYIPYGAAVIAECGAVQVLGRGPIVMPDTDNIDIAIARQHHR